MFHFYKKNWKKLKQKKFTSLWRTDSTRRLSGQTIIVEWKVQYFPLKCNSELYLKGITSVNLVYFPPFLTFSRFEASVTHLLKCIWMTVWLIWKIDQTTRWLQIFEMTWIEQFKLENWWTPYLLCRHEWTIFSSNWKKKWTRFFLRWKKINRLCFFACLIKPQDLKCSFLLCICWWSITFISLLFTEKNNQTFAVKLPLASTRTWQHQITDQTWQGGL